MQQAGALVIKRWQAALLYYFKKWNEHLCSACACTVVEESQHR